MATEQNIFGDYALQVNSHCDLEFILSGRHSYSNLSGSKPWQLAVYIDGNLINSIGGSGAITDTPNLQAVAKSVPAGNHTIRATWFGNNDMTLSGSVLFITAFYK